MQSSRLAPPAYNGEGRSTRPHPRRKYGEGFSRNRPARAQQLAREVDARAVVVYADEPLEVTGKPVIRARQRGGPVAPMARQGRFALQSRCPKLRDRGLPVTRGGTLFLIT